jgi:hypothetical protein
MAGVKSSLAMLLSLLTVATSLSASTCDLACWLRPAHSNCHGVGSGAAVKEMAMSGGMYMGSGQPRGAAGRHTSVHSLRRHCMSSEMGVQGDHSESMTRLHVNATPGHSMSMSPQVEIAAEPFAPVRKPETNMANPTTVLPCADEPCSNTSVGASPPSIKSSYAPSAHWTAIGIVSLVNLGTDLHRTSLGTPLPKLLAADSLSAILRI